MFMAATLPAVRNVSFNFWDGIFAVWVIVGIFVGRKRGMSQELLPALKWIAIAVLSGLLWGPVSTFVFKNTNGAFNHLWSNITGYLIIAFLINLAFISLKNWFGEKLTSSDFFGRAEYYLGMFSGLLQFVSILIVLLALMNSRVYSDAELAADEQVQKKNFEDIKFPTYMSIQHAILKESFTGQFVRSKGYRLLIAPAGEAPPTESAAKKEEQQINMILGPGKK